MCDRKYICIYLYTYIYYIYIYICIYAYMHAYLPRNAKGNSTIFGAEIAREQETFLTPSANSQQ